MKYISDEDVKKIREKILSSPSMLTSDDIPEGLVNMMVFEEIMKYLGLKEGQSVIPYNPRVLDGDMVREIRDTVKDELGYYSEWTEATIYSELCEFLNI